MKMQDKEFDTLFRSKLNDLEVEPSQNVWAGITARLDNKRGSGALISWLSIAASVIVLVTAGIIFIPKKGTHPDKPMKDGMAKVAHPATATTVSKADTQEVQPQGIVGPAPAVNRVAHVKMANKDEQMAHTQTAPAGPIPPPITAPKEQPVIAAVLEKQNVITPVVPGNETPLTIKPGTDDSNVIPAKQIAAANVQPADVPEAAVVKPRHRTHGIAGLLNAVIATVDKRKDKIIEFTNADDDESNIGGVNLGIVKFKKEGR